MAKLKILTINTDMATATHAGYVGNLEKMENPVFERHPEVKKQSAWKSNKIKMWNSDKKMRQCCNLKEKVNFKFKIWNHVCKAKCDLREISAYISKLTVVKDAAENQTCLQLCTLQFWSMS